MRRLRNPERRRSLLDAAIRVLADDGAGGLTHRAVDRAAGVPVGTTKNYFPTGDALFAAVSEYLVTERQAGLTRFTRATPGSGRDVLATELGDFLHRVASGESPEGIAGLELFLAASRRPSVRQILDQHRLAYLQRLTELANSLGSPARPHDVAVVDAVFRGLAITLRALSPATRQVLGLDDCHALARTFVALLYPGDRPDVTAHSAPMPS